ARAAGAQARAAIGALDLPLFKDRRPDDDTPLVTAPAVPRTPLAVRRSSPLVTRGNGRAADEPALDLDGDQPYVLATRFEPRSPRAAQIETTEPSENVPSAGAIARVLAALIDGVILASVGLVILYFTLEVCRLQFNQLALLPVVPFSAFVLLLWGGYFTLFTVAGGQTIGKMAARIKVVSVEDEGRWSGRVPLGRAVLRAAGYLVSTLPVGLGFLPGLFGADRRAVHDRLADTRVVKA
ncbi:MAG: RDD family protein, partial [Acidobacteriota bacterium]